MDVCYRTDTEIHYVKDKVKHLSPDVDDIGEWLRIKDLFKDAALRANVKKGVESLKKLNQKYDKGSQTEV